MSLFSASFGELVTVNLLLCSWAVDDDTDDDILGSSADGDDTDATVAAGSPEGTWSRCGRWTSQACLQLTWRMGGRAYRKVPRIVDRMTKEATSSTSQTYGLGLGNGPDAKTQATARRGARGALGRGGGRRHGAERASSWLLSFPSILIKGLTCIWRAGDLGGRKEKDFGRCTTQSSWSRI